MLRSDHALMIYNASNSSVLNKLTLKLMLTDCQVDIIAKTLEPQFMGPTKFLSANGYT